MQGTLLMLVAFSGLGCHNRGCDVAYSPPSFSSCFGVGYGCYADCYPGPVTPGCYAGCYGGCYSGCYGGWGGGCYGTGYAGCYGGCYGGGCYGGWYGGCYGGGYSGCGGKHRHGCGGGGGLFSCFHKKRCNTCCDYGYAMPACYGSAYAPPVFGSALGMNYAPLTSGQSVVSGQSMVSSQSLTAPSKQYGGTSTTTTMPSEVTAPVPPTPVTPRATSPAVEGVTPPPAPTPAIPGAGRVTPPST